MPSGLDIGLSIGSSDLSPLRLFAVGSLVNFVNGNLIWPFLSISTINLIVASSTCSPFSSVSTYATSPSSSSSPSFPSPLIAAGKRCRVLGSSSFGTFFIAMFVLASVLGHIHNNVKLNKKTTNYGVERR